MKTLSNLVDKIKGKPILIIGAGSSLKEYREEIDKFIKETNSFTIGINNMVDFWVPHFHLFTNTQRFRTFGSKIHENSTILLGQGIPLKLKDEILKGRNYYLINFKDQKGLPIAYSKGKVTGFFRTAGCLSIMLSNIMGASEINIVGMDGYTFYKKEDVEKGKKSQHCYGQGHTDTADWETCVLKDGLINEVLTGIREYGIDFNIITPTKYERFYDSSRLHDKGRRLSE